MRKQYKNRYQERGFSLLEVLVAILLIAVGIVTMVMLQSRALQYSQAAFYQGLGMQIANGLVSSARANPDGLSDPVTSANSYNRGGSYNPSAPGHAVAAPGAACYAAQCTPAKMAAADIEWGRWSARQLLPEGDIFITPTTIGGADFLDVVMVWDGAQTKDGVTLPCDGLGINVTAATNPQCLLLRVAI